MSLALQAGVLASGATLIGFIAGAYVGSSFFRKNGTRTGHPEPSVDAEGGPDRRARLIGEFAPRGDTATTRNSVLLPPSEDDTTFAELFWLIQNFECAAVSLGAVEQRYGDARTNGFPLADWDAGRKKAKSDLSRIRGEIMLLLRHVAHRTIPSPIPPVMPSDVQAMPAITRTFSIRRDGSTVTIVLGDQLIIGNRERFKQLMLLEIELGADRIVVDMSKGAYIDSSGLGAMYSVSRTIHARGGRFEAIGVCQDFFVLFELTKLDSMFDSIQRLEEAPRA